MKGNKKIRSGLFRKYLLVTISIILASFVFLGGALLLLVSKLWMEEKMELLGENAINVAQSTSNTLQNDFSEGVNLVSVKLICNTLMQTSSAIDADVFIVNHEGYVVFCKDNLQPNLSLYTGNCMVHSNYRISPENLKKSLGGVTGYMGDLDGALSGVNFIVSAPVRVGNEIVGVVYATQPVLDGLAPYVFGIFRMFFWAALLALLLAFL